MVRTFEVDVDCSRMKDKSQNILVRAMASYEDLTDSKNQRSNIKKFGDMFAWVGIFSKTVDPSKAEVHTIEFTA